jgi:urease accessory protein
MAESAHDPSAELAALQFGDSFFPSGAVSFSLGLETLHADGIVTDADGVRAFLETQLAERWAPSERAFLVAAYCAFEDWAAIAEIDALQEAVTLPRELREGSRKGGAALLGVHSRMGTPGAAAYRDRLRAGKAHGHLAVVQGVVMAGAGLDLGRTEAVSAHGLCVTILGAALRLGIIGHLDGQIVLRDLRPTIAEILATPAPDLAEVKSYVPLADVAAMRHETAASRLFSN